MDAGLQSLPVWTELFSDSVWRIPLFDCQKNDMRFKPGDKVLFMRDIPVIAYTCDILFSHTCKVKRIMERNNTILMSVCISPSHSAWVSGNSLSLVARKMA